MTDRLYDKLIWNIIQKNIPELKEKVEKIVLNLE